MVETSKQKVCKIEIEKWHLKIKIILDMHFTKEKEFEILREEKSMKIDQNQFFKLQKLARNN